MATQLQRTFTTPSGGVYKWTYSFWVKRSKLGSDQAMASATYSSSYQSRILFRSDDQLEVFDYRNNSYRVQKKTTRKFRDTSAWYHIVVSNDNTQASADNRTKIYVNGVQETSFSTNTQYTQNQTTSFNNDYPNYLGSYGSGDYLDGSMSHFHFIDGTAYAPTEFGETDSTTGEWKIKTNVSVTYGANGFFILKDGNSVTDQSGNSNNFTVGAGTLTKTEDNPSNVFATLNPLVPDAGSTGLYHGNNQLNVNTANWRSAFSTLGMSSGKFYFESYIEAGGYIHLGARGVEQSDGSLTGNNDWIGVTSQGWSYDKTGEVKNNNSTVASGKATYGNTDIIGCLLDLDNWTINWTKNGTLINSTAYNITQNLTYVFGVSGHSTARIRTNFGNGYFQTTAVSSAGTNASGNGIFEYDVPTGYTALSTKGLNL